MIPMTVQQWQAMSKAEANKHSPIPNTTSTAMTRKVTSAEWQCTQCGVTNRRLVPKDAREAADRCMHCGRKHKLRIDARPVRWNAEAA